MNTPRRPWTAVIAIACTLACALPLSAAQDGELFPEVGAYEDNVQSPISKPEKAITQKPLPPIVAPPVVTPPPVTPEPPQTPEVKTDDPPIDPNDPNQTRKPPRKITTRNPSGTQPATAPATAPAPPPPPLIELRTYAAEIMSSMLTPEDNRLFLAEYSDIITKAHAGSVEQRKKTADLLEEAATSITTPTLKRYVLLHAFALNIRASTPLTERVQKAEVLLTMLTERTLPVVQARADALNDLMLTVSSTPNERFMDLYIEAHALLAKLQVQAGYPKDAQDSLRKAREIALRHTRKSKTRIDQINEAAAWCNRATEAAALWPKYQAALKTNPDDPVANTMIATLHISLAGNLEAAIPFAAKSNRKDLTALAEVLKANPPRSLSKDPKEHALQVLAICNALLDVAKATPVNQTFDRYSLACYAGDHMEQMIADGIVPPEKNLSSRALLVAAKDVVDKTHLRRGEDLPKWLGGGGAANIAAKAPPARTIGTVPDLFKGLPKELAPTPVGWTRRQADDVNEWLRKNVVGQTWASDAFITDVRQPVDGPDGKVQVPIQFVIRDVQMTDTFFIVTTINQHVSPQVAAKACDMNYGQVFPIKGTIFTARIDYFMGNGNRAFLRIEIK